ncbi:MAG: DUF2282 domain-containing protein [Gammaproteobacteria bacterium]|nr:DUF2282 domain-containing protein [Gammaproteobacteria bacterium]
MKSPNTVMSTAITSLLALGTLAITTSAYAAEALVVCKEQERCYGVSKANKNDCSTSSSVCAGTAKQDYQKDAWLYVPKGSCERLAGGSLTVPSVIKKQ